jgi:hypothetical protein
MRKKGWTKKERVNEYKKKIDLRITGFLDFVHRPEFFG